MLQTLDPLHLFGGRMNLSLSIECQSLVATHDRDRHVVARADKERGVDDVVRLMDFPAPNLQQNVARVDSAVRCGCVIENLGYFRRRPRFRFQRLHQVRADPAMSHFAKTQEIAPDFFRRLDRQSVAGRIVFQSERNNAHDFSLHVEER